MRQTKYPIKDANQIIDQFTAQCDVAKASTVFIKLTLANVHYRDGKSFIHPDAAWNVDPKQEEVKQAIQAISTLLYEIEKTFKQ